MLEQVVTAVHVMQPVATVRNKVVAEDKSMAEVDDDIACAAHHVPLHQNIVAVPQTDAVTTHAQRAVLADDAIADHSAATAVLEVDAEQHIL